MTTPQPLTSEQWRDEVHEHRMARIRANSQQIADMLDRMREEDSWPEEIRRDRYRRKAAGRGTPPA